MPHAPAPSPHRRHPAGNPRMAWATGLAASLLTLAPGGPAQAADPASWQACAALDAQPQARLACFDAWAQRQTAEKNALADRLSPGDATAPPASARAALADAPTPSPAAPPTPLVIRIEPVRDGCRNRAYSDLSRFWELEAGSSCDTFDLRGYRPISLSLVTADGVNGQPTSGNPLNNAPGAVPYRHTETRLQLSVRTKLAQGLLTYGDPERRDSLWFGYTQQSYWQLFTGALSRPFRSTDHEPEFIYIHPTDARLPLGWRLRYSGVGLVHQSNGQSLPLSRSWNRAYLMAGMERDNVWRVQARIWQRLPESRDKDDNPDISNTVGRAELAATWNPDPAHTLALTLRHSLRARAHGSARLEWLRTVGSGATSGLRFHVQLFSGYGDSLLDFNRRRTVLGVGLSLVDF